MKPIRKVSWSTDGSGSVCLGRSCDGIVEVDGDTAGEKSDWDSERKDASRRVDRSRMVTRSGRSLED